MAVFRVPGFELGEPMGLGDLGMVFDARELGPESRRAAVRVVSAAPFFDGVDGSQLFLGEAEGLRLLSHPAAVRTLAFGLTEDASRSPFLAAEFFEGRPLASAAKELSPDEVVGAVASVLEGLAAAHAAGVLHLHVRPTSLLLGGDGKAALVDYGLAYLWQAKRDRTYPAWLLDALSYAPPEAQPGPCRGTPKHDVFSCGAVLYETLAGERFDARRPRRLSSFARELVGLDHIVDRALDSEGRRYPDAGSFAAELREWHDRRREARSLPRSSPRLEAFEEELLDEKLEAREAAQADEALRRGVRAAVLRWHNVAATAGLEAFAGARRRLDEAGMDYGFEALRPGLSLADDPPGGVTPYFAVIHPGGKRRLVFGSCPDWSAALPGRESPLCLDGRPSVRWLGDCWLVYVEEDGRPGVRDVRGLLCCAIPDEKPGVEPEVQLFRDSLPEPGGEPAAPARLGKPQEVYEYLVAVALSVL